MTRSGSKGLIEGLLGRARARAGTHDLPAPHVPQASGGDIDPDLGGATIAIEIPLAPEMKPDDRITLFVRTELEGKYSYFQVDITLDESNLVDPIRSSCDAKFLQRALGGTAEFYYDVSSGLYSDTLELRIRRGSPLPLAPWVEGTVGGNGTQLRMDDLNGRNVVVQVQDHTGAEGDEIRVLWTLAGDAPVVTDPKTVPAGGGNLTFEIPYHEANERPGNVVVTYELTRPGQPPVSSRTRTLAVFKSTVAPNLPPPEVDEADANHQLDPLAVDTLTIRIPADAPINSGDTLEWSWEGSSAEGIRQGTVTSPVGNMTIAVDPAVLAFNLGGPVRVMYRLLHAGQPARPSNSRIVIIRPIEDQSPELPAPTFTEAGDEELDMGSFEDEAAHLIVPRYPLAADGQLYWLTITGEDASGGELVIPVATQAPIEVGIGTIITLSEVARAQLEAFKDDSTLTVELKVTFNQSDDDARAVRFPLKTLRIKQEGIVRLPAPALEEAVGDEVDPGHVDSLTAVLPASLVFLPGDTVDVRWEARSDLGDATVHVAAPMPGMQVSIPLKVLAFALDQEVELSYTRTRGNDTVHSEILALHIGPLTQDHFDAPRIEEALENELRMEDLVDDLAHIAIDPYRLAADGQKYWLFIAGEDKEGSPLKFELAVAADIDLPDEGPIALAEASRAQLELFGDGTVLVVDLMVAFDQSDDEGNATSFPLAEYTIRQVARVPAPVVVEAPDGILDPLAAPTLRIRIPADAPIKAGDTLHWEWKGETSNGTRSDKENTPVPGMTITVGTEVLPFNLAGTVVVTYTLRHDGEGDRKSDECIVHIEAIEDNDARLTRPTFAEASATELDMGSFDGDVAHLVVPRYPLAADGQYGWLILSGEDESGGIIEWPVFTKKAIVVGDATIIALDEANRSQLEVFKDGAEVVLAFKVTFDQSEDEGNAVLFPRTTLSIKQAEAERLPPPTLLEANAGGLVHPIEAKTLTMQLPDGDVFAPGDTVDVFWTEASGKGSFTAHLDELPPDRRVSIPLSVLAFALNENVGISYTRHRGSTSAPSEVRTLRVGGLPDGVFPKPFIREASERELDMYDLEDDAAHILVEHYPLAADGQRYWLDILAAPPGGSPITIEIARNAEIKLSGEGAIALGEATRVQLESLPDRTFFAVMLRVTLDESQLEGNAHSFPGTAYVLRQIRETAPPAPWVEGTVDGAGRELHMVDLDGGDVRVIAVNHTGRRGDFIRALWTPAGGDTYATPPKSADSESEIPFDIPYDEANQRSGKVDVAYELTRGEQPVVTSLARTLDVFAAIEPPRLPAPTVVEADATGQLDPLAAGRLTIRIPADVTIKHGDTLRWAWTTSIPDGDREGTVSAPEAGMNIPVDLSALAFAIGLPVRVTYTLRHEGELDRQSHERLITVNQIDGDSRLPSPTFLDAGPDTLDLEDVKGDVAQIVMPRYQLAADRQRCWLTFRGKRSDGSDAAYTVRSSGLIDLGSGGTILLGSVPRVFLTDLADASPIYLELSITFNGSTDMSQAVRFRPKELIFHKFGREWFPKIRVLELDLADSISPWDVTTLTAVFPEGVRFQPGDDVRIEWLSNDRSERIRVDDPAPDKHVPLPFRWLVQAHDQTITCRYVVVRNDVPLYSPPLHVDVGAIEDYDPRFPTPTIREIDGDIVYLDNVAQDAHALVDRFHFSEPGLEYSTHVRSPLQYIALHQAIIGTPPFSIGNIPRPWLKMSLTGPGPYFLEVGVNLRGIPDVPPARLTALPPLRFRVIESPDIPLRAPHVPEANDIQRSTVAGRAAKYLSVALPSRGSYVPGDKVQVQWRGATREGTRIIDVDGTPIPGMHIPVDPRVLAHNNGGAVVTYTITRKGIVHTSPALHFRLPQKTKPPRRNSTRKSR